MKRILFVVFCLGWLLVFSVKAQSTPTSSPASTKAVPPSQPATQTKLTVTPTVYYTTDGSFALNLTIPNAKPTDGGFDVEHPSKNHIWLGERGSLDVCWEPWPIAKEPVCRDSKKPTAIVKSKHEITINGDFREQPLWDGEHIIKVRTGTNEFIGDKLKISGILHWMSGLGYHPEFNLLLFICLSLLLYCGARCVVELARKRRPYLVMCAVVVLVSGAGLIALFRNEGVWKTLVPLMISVLLTSIILGVIVLFGLSGKEEERYIIGREKFFWTALLLDKEGNTYSLSKLQFFLWTVVCLFSYSYLSLCRLFFQGDFTFAPLPDEFPGIILISGTTGAVAQAANAFIGPKGAGQEQPRWADLITSGGVFALDRLQFLVWTILGITFFLLLLLFPDPAQLREVPELPETFLTLMGLSSFGYLGTKIARGPGPVIHSMKVTQKDKTLTFALQGKSLPESLEKASILIDQKEVKQESLTDVTSATEAPKGETFSCDWTPSDPEFWKKTEHTFTIGSKENKQEASCKFRLAPFISGVTEGTNTLTITGEWLSKTATIEAGGKKPNKQEIKAPQKDAAGKEVPDVATVLELTFDAGLPTKPYTIQLTNPDGQSAEINQA